MKIDIDEVQVSIKKINNELETISNTVTALEKYIGNVEIWKSDYQKTFDRYLKNGLIIHLKQIIRCCEKYSVFLNKQISKYQKIDTVR